MYSKDEAARLRQEFWTTFGKYISPHLSADGMKINWINYKTGIKNLHFRMQAENRSASIAIEVTHPDTGIQELFFEQFQELKNVLNNYLNEEWDWELHVQEDSGKMISRISKTVAPASIYNRADWPLLISFFKPRIIALDEFWSDARYSFDALK